MYVYICIYIYVDTYVHTYIHVYREKREKPKSIPISYGSPLEVSDIIAPLGMWSLNIIGILVSTLRPFLYPSIRYLEIWLVIYIDCNHKA